MAHRNGSTDKLILKACQMSFSGVKSKEIAAELDVTDTTVSRWKSTELWQEFHAELIDNYKRELQTEVAATRVAG